MGKFEVGTSGHGDWTSQFIADCDPAVMQVVAPSENLQVIPVGNEPLDQLIDLLGLLTLAAALAEDDVAASIEIGLVANITFYADQASLLGVL